MSTLWTPQILSDIALRIRTDEAIRFWDEDDQGNPYELENEHIIRYLNDFLPAVGIFNLANEGTKGIPELALIFFFENRVEKINLKQFETLIRKVLEEAGYAKVNQLMHFKKGKFFGSNIILSIPSLEDKKIMRDDRENSFIFYANGYVKIASDKVTSAMPYSSLPADRYIWNDSISPRQYRPSNTKIKSGDLHFRDFVANLSRDPNGEFNDESFEKLQIALGYLCHRFNKGSERKCVILMDRQHW